MTEQQTVRDLVQTEPTPRARRHIVARHLLAVLVAVAIVAFAFLYRFNALGGSLGGFDNEDFFVITRADMVLDGQRPLRDFVDAELRGAWPSLSYAVPAWAQMLWGRSLLVIASLNVGALALCGGIVFLLARQLSRRWLVALLASGVVVVSGVKLYNYPKVLSLTIGAVAIRWTLSNPTIPRIAALSAWTTIAGLFRHDYAVYIGVAAVAGLIAFEPKPWTGALRRVGVYVGCGVLFALPSIAGVARDWGLARYVDQALLAPVTEGLRLAQWPVLSPSTPLTPDSLIAFNYYSFWIIPVLGLAVLALLPAGSGDRASRARFATGIALVAMALVANYYFLRGNLSARLGDAAVPVMLLAAWSAGAAAMMGVRGARLIGAVGLPVVLALQCAAFVRVNSVVQELGSGRITESPAAAIRQFDVVRRTLGSLPPKDWTGQDLAGPLGAARYLADCTAPDDNVLVAAYAYEVPYFARRRFAGGQGLFSHGYFRDETYQRLVLERLASQSVPILFTDVDYDAFVDDYPLVARYVSDHYRDAGIIDVYGVPYLRVFVEQARHPIRTDAIVGLPCFR